MSNKSQRLSWRARCRRWQRYINALLAMLAALALVLWPAPAGAYPMRCRYISHGQICYSSIDGQKVARCDRGYWLTAQFTCKAVQP